MRDDPGFVPSVNTLWLFKLAQLLILVFSTVPPTVFPCVLHDFSSTMFVKCLNRVEMKKEETGEDEEREKGEDEERGNGWR